MEHKETQIAWIGMKERIGFEIDLVESIDSIEFGIIDTSKKFCRYDHPIYGNLPIFNLNQFYNLPALKESNLVVINQANEFIGVYITGDINIQALPKSGNLDNIGFDSIVFQTEKHLIQDFAVFEQFIGYLVNIEELWEFVINNNEEPAKFVHVEEVIDEIDFFVVESPSQNYCIPLEEIEYLIKTNQVDSELYDLDIFIKGEIETFRYKTPLFCLKLRNQPQHFSTVGAVDVIKFKREEIKSILSDSTREPLVSLSNGNIAKIIVREEN